MIQVVNPSYEGIDNPNKQVFKADIQGLSAQTAGYITRSEGFANSEIVITDPGDEDVIISRSRISAEDLKSGTVEKEIAFSPVILSIPKHLYLDENFTLLPSNQGSSYEFRLIDIRSILQAVMESDDEFLDLESHGFTTGGLADKGVRFVIPDKSSIYRKDVINSLILILSDGKEITELNRDSIMGDLQVVLSKSLESKNILNWASESNYIVMLPEYALAEAGASSGVFKLAYWDNCYSSKIYIYHDNANEEKVNTLITDIQSKDEFFSKTWYRNTKQLQKNRTGVQQNAADSVTTLELQDNIEAILGDKYWTK